MQKDLKLFFILFLSLNLISCSTLSKLKFWGDDEEEIEVPALLQEINQNIIIKDLWVAKVGKAKSIGRVLPAISGDRIFYINPEGLLSVFDTSSGNIIFTKETNDQVSGGTETGFKKILYATSDGEVVALNIENGEEIWRAQTTSEVLSPVVTDGSIVVSQSTDGSITGFDLNSGQKQWIHQVSVPNLSLRGTSIPLLEQDFIFTGFANGSVAMIYPESGSIRLEYPITINEGTSELERIVDVDGKVVVDRTF